MLLEQMLFEEMLFNQMLRHSFPLSLNLSILVRIQIWVLQKCIFVTQIFYRVAVEAGGFIIHLLQYKSLLRSVFVFCYA